MAITKRTEQDQIEVVGQFKHIQVRTATVIEEDGTELSRTYHRHVIAPEGQRSIVSGRIVEAKYEQC